jgi:hypothetical protein
LVWVDDGRPDENQRNHGHLCDSGSYNVCFHAENRGKTGQDNVTELLKVVDKNVVCSI